MLGSEVPPCRTITFVGGQFVGALDVAVFGALPVAPGSVGAGLEPGPDWPAAGVLLQLDAVTFFLCGAFLTVVGRVCPADVCAGGGAEDGVGDAAGGFCAGGVVP